MTGFADVELGLHAYLSAAFPSARVVTDLPANMADHLPIVQVQRTGGGDFDVVLDAAEVEVDVYAGERRAAAVLCEQVRERLRFDLPGRKLDGAQVYAVGTIGGPASRPFDVTGVRRFGASFSLTTRKVSNGKP